MTASDVPCKWQICEHSVRGASHERAGKPNQDWLVSKLLESQTIAIAVLADGHGSRKSFRSERGAQFAAEITLSELQEYAPATTRSMTLSELSRDAEVELPQRIVRGWQQRVDDDLRCDPITEADVARLSETERTNVRDNPRVAYGTTVVGALMLPECAIYIQLGDGDVLIVSDDAAESSRPLPPDQQSFANETASLASAGPMVGSKRPGGPRGPCADFRVRVIPTVSDRPALVLLTTDGYANAFVTDAGFRQAAIDFLSLGQSEGWEFVRTQLPGWLNEASREGSGDDVTVILLVREKVSTTLIEPSALSLPRPGEKEIESAIHSPHEARNAPAPDAPATSENS